MNSVDSKKQRGAGLDDTASNNHHHYSNDPSPVLCRTKGKYLFIIKDNKV